MRLVHCHCDHFYYSNWIWMIYSEMIPRIYNTIRRKIRYGLSHCRKNRKCFFQIENHLLFWSFSSLKKLLAPCCFPAVLLHQQPAAARSFLFCRNRTKLSSFCILKSLILTNWRERWFFSFVLVHWASQRMQA